MAGSLNRTTLMGNLGRDPEVRTTQLGSRVATFSVATTDSWTDKNSGEKREHTEWHQIVVWNEALIDHVIEPHVHKGDRIYLEGSNRTRKWTDDHGTDRYRTEVTVGRFDGKIILLGRNGNGRPDPTAPNAPGYDSTALSAGGTQHSGADLDDEIPF